MASFSIIEPSGLIFAQTAGPSKTEDWDGPPLASGSGLWYPFPDTIDCWILLPVDRYLPNRAGLVEKPFQFFSRCPHSLACVYYSRLNAIRPNYRVMKLYRVVKLH